MQCNECGATDKHSPLFKVFLNGDEKMLCAGCVNEYLRWERIER